MSYVLKKIGDKEGRYWVAAEEWSWSDADAARFVSSDAAAAHAEYMKLREWIVHPAPQYLINTAHQGFSDAAWKSAPRAGEESKKTPG